MSFLEGLDDLYGNIDDGIMHDEGKLMYYYIPLGQKKTITSCDLAGPQYIYRNFTDVIPGNPPPTISNFAASVVNQDVVLNWQWGGYLDIGFNIYTVIGSTSTKIGYNSPSQLTYTDPGAANSLPKTYYIEALSTSGTSNSYNIIVFPAPTLPSPNNNSSGVPINTTLSWNACQGADLYHLQVSADPLFNNIFYDNMASTPQSSIPQLSYGTTYYWHVCGIGLGYTSAWSSTWSFTTVPPPPPAAPTLVSPATNAANVSMPPALSWNASAGATSYELQVSSNSTFTSIAYDNSSLTGTSAQINGLANGTNYYWRVNATNAGGTSAWSGVWQFQTMITPPALSSPVNGATNVSTTPTLSWGAVTGGYSYQLQVSTDSTFSSATILGSSGTSYTLGTTLSNNTTYYWRVSTSNPGGGQSSWSSTWKFTTIPTPPAPPPLSSPANGAMNISRTPTLSWSACTGAASYGLQVAIDAGFTSLVVNQAGIAGTSYAITTTLASSTTYYWRVNATNAGGTSGWSSGWSFITAPPPPAAPTLISPANGATNIPITAKLIWHAVSGATSYTVNGIWGNKVVNDTSYSPSLSYSYNYTWSVTANNAGGSTTSASWSFTTVPAPPVAPTLSSPANGATNVSRTPTLSWSASTGATSYTVNGSWGSATVTSTSYTTPTLATGTTYTWSVTATNTGGSSTSATWSFTTLPAPPAAPTLISPSNGATNVPINAALSWNAVSGATSYTVNGIWGNAAVTGTSYSPSLSYNYNFSWSVTAINGGGSATSATWTFKTVPAPPPAPTLSSPTNGATNVSRAPTLSWSASSGATSYTVNGSWGSATVTGTSYKTPTLAASTRFSWSVTATNAGGSSTSGTWSFTTGTLSKKSICIDGTESDYIPEIYSLYQNYPNPFNPSTTIQFDLHNTTRVVLKIYNMLGKEVRTLINEEVEAGSYTLQWNGQDEHGRTMPSGMYFYRLSTEMFSGTKKMMLLR